jgi:hypothetical protein
VKWTAPRRVTGTGAAETPKPLRLHALLLLVARAPVPLQRGALTRTQLQHFASRGKGRMNQESCASFLPDKWGAYPSGASGQKY